VLADGQRLLMLRPERLRVLADGEDPGPGFNVLAATLALGACIGNAVAQQPHMYAALDALRTARAELIAATPNKGGHRARAITLVNQAIDETNAGIRYAQ
jgi:hypothetical protein